MFDLTGKRFLITGAGSEHGIGFSAATALQKLGASVFLTSLSPRVHERGNEILAFSHCADLTKPKEVAELIALAAEKLGGLDGVINNAGMTSVLHPPTGEFFSS